MVYKPAFGTPDMETCLKMVGLFLFVFIVLKPAPKSGRARKLKADTDYTKNPGLAGAMKNDAPRTGKRYAVLGAGQVGMRIVDALLMRGEEHVRAFDLVPPRRESRVNEGASMHFMRGDITRLEDCKRAVEGAHVVFLTAALIRFADRLSFQYAPVHAVNVLGTENVIAACIECSVPVLIQTSTSNVCVSEENCNKYKVFSETTPVVTKASSPNHYGWTKVQAEQRILEADGTSLANGGTLHTSALRACSCVFGPDDNVAIEFALRNGCMYMVHPEARIDWVFVDNLVWAHLLLERRLHQHRAASGSSSSTSEADTVHGHVFSVSNFDPCTKEDIFTMAQDAAPWLALHYFPLLPLLVLAHVVEGIQWLTRNGLRGDIALATPAALNTAKFSYAVDCSKAECVLGYKPLYSLDEGVQMSVAQWKETQPPGMKFEAWKVHRAPRLFEKAKRL